MIGQLLDGRYQIIRTLGAGGFGQTFIAEDHRRPGHPVCVVKHLKPASSDPKFLETARRLFQNEAETLEKLGNHHDQIPRLLAFFEQEQEFYLVQEFIEGITLGTELGIGKPWTEAQVIDLLEEVLKILQFVHEQGVIHRDVKPDNIIRRQSDQKLCLVDFGAVKQVRTQMATVQGQMSATIAVGTPGYMPSEQGQGKPRPSSDIYALGIIGIQALTGTNPAEFQEDLETGEILWQHSVTVSPGLADVLSRMVKCYFKERYPSAAATLQALQQIRLGYTPTQQVSYTPTQQVPVSPPQKTAVPETAPTPIAPMSTQPTTPIGGQPVTQEQIFTQPQPPRSNPSKSGIPKGVLWVGSLLVAAMLSLGIVMGVSRYTPTGGTDRGSEILANALQKANAKDYGGAIAIAQTIPADSSAYAQAQQEITQWQSLLEQGQNLPNNNGDNNPSNPNIAIGGGTRPSNPTRPTTGANPPADPPGKATPPTPPTQSDHHTSPGPHQEPTHTDRGKITLDEAWVQADAGNFEAAITIAQSIPESSAAYAEAQELISSWQAALNQSSPTPSEQPVECSAYANGSVSQFSDLSPTDANFQAVQSAVESWGVLGGCTDGTFRGNAPASQADYDAVQNALTQSGLDANCVYSYLAGGQTRYQLASLIAQIQSACYASNPPADESTSAPGPI